MAEPSTKRTISEEQRSSEPDSTRAPELSLEARRRAWQEMRALAREVAGAWKSDLSAVEAIREQRR